MTFQVAAEAAERMVSRIAAIKRETCRAARDVEKMDRDEMYEYFRDRYLGIGIDIDGPELVGDSEVPLYEPRPRRPPRKGFKWVLVDGKWREVKQNTSGGG